ncbi:unnamed protein product [Wuchereria bancrofti]|uniref:Uncharacterized protein n=1 Tax=Wuchereria bancrofti TaxID=6293 RepID=A0A3P7ELR9_WUCBA|nr:unnamed protein product [Wuchereria bancrofti]
MIFTIRLSTKNGFILGLSYAERIYLVELVVLVVSRRIYKSWFSVVFFRYHALALMHRLRHVDNKQNELLKYASATLGSGDLREAVKLPQGEDPNEWIAVNGTCASVDNQEFY